MLANLLRIADGLGLVTLLGIASISVLALRIADGLGLVTLLQCGHGTLNSLRIADGLGLVTLLLLRGATSVGCGLLTGWDWLHCPGNVRSRNRVADC